jgi:hypothetical protein
MNMLTFGRDKRVSDVRYSYLTAMSIDRRCICS